MKHQNIIGLIEVISAPHNRSSEDYSFQDFGIQFVYDKFCDDVIEKKKQLNYGQYIGFKSKEECQKYCDWLNRRKDIYDEDIS